MELVSTIEISGEEREIADAYARGQIAANAQNIATNVDGITELNNNLSQLEFGENAGGKNLFNPDNLLNAEYDYDTETIKVTSNLNNALDMVFKEDTQYTFSAYITQLNEETYIRFKVNYTDGTSNNYFLFSADLTEKYYSQTTAKGKTISEVKWYFNTNGTATFRNLQIEEGDTATPYKPYIPSVKMLAEDVAELNKELSDSLPIGTILTVVDSATMSSDMWKLLKTGTLSYQDGGALVEISTITYQKIK